MAISRAQMLKELLPGLNALFGLEYEGYDSEDAEIYETENSDRSFEEEVKLSGFGQAPVKNGELIYKGKVGKDISIDAGIKAAELCCVNIIAALKKSINGDWNKLDTFLKLGGFVNCNNDFYDQPKIINGASDLLVNIFGEQGKHARFAVGSNSLPMNISVEIDAIIKIK